MAASGQNVALVWHDYKDKTEVINMRTSQDSGQTWIDSVLFEGTRPSYPQVAAVADGFVVSWLTEKDGRGDWNYKVIKGF